jgi:hypothetical protein
MPPSQGGLRGYHVYSGSEPHLPERKGSGAATCTVTLDPASLLRRALMYYMSYGSGSYLSSRRAPVLPHVLQFPVDRGPQT